MKHKKHYFLYLMVCFLIGTVAVARADDDIQYEFSVKTSGGDKRILDYLPAFAQRGFTLYLFVGSGDIGSCHFKAILERADALGIKVKISPGVPGKEGGPFPKESNIEAFEKEIHTILDYAESINDAVKTVVFNIETGPPVDHLFQEAAAKRDLKQLARLAIEQIDRDTFLKSTEHYEVVAQRVRARGYEVQITTFALLLDDFADGDTDLQDVFNIPMEGISWDTRSFCAYSTEYGHLGAFPVTPYFVYSYARTARERYGDNTWIAVGLIRNNERGYKTPDELAADIAAAKAAGIRKIDLFCFSGMLDYPEYSFDDWADATLAPPAVPELNWSILGVRTGMCLADLILNYIK